MIIHAHLNHDKTRDAELKFVDIAGRDRKIILHGMGHNGEISC